MSLRRRTGILVVFTLLATIIGSFGVFPLHTTTDTVEAANRLSHPKFIVPVDGVGSTIEIGSHGPGDGAHTGADLYAVDYIASSPTGDRIPIYAASRGRVVFSGETNDYGYSVAVRHWNNSSYDAIYYSVYAHLDGSGLPEVGKIVGTNKRIGYMGMSGRSNGVVHLHFVVRTGPYEHPESGEAALYGYGYGSSPFDIRSVFGY